MATRLIGTDNGDPRLPAAVVVATQGYTIDDLAPGTTLADAYAYTDEAIADVTVGGVSFADDAETIAGTATTKAVTPAGLRAATPIPDLRSFGAKADGTTDDTAALQAAVDSGEAFVVNGRVRITAPIVIDQYSPTINGVSNWGFSTSKSQIFQATAGAPIFVLDDVRGVVIRDLALEYATPDTDADAIAITTDGIVGQCSFENLFIRNAGVGIGMNQAAAQSTIFSSTFSNIRINEFGVCALDMRMKGGGSTGCTFDAIYTNAGGGLAAHGPDRGTIPPARFSQVHDWSVRGLHVEGVTADFGVEIANCRGFRLESVHFEAFTAGITNGALVHIASGNPNTVFLDVINVEGCYFLGADTVTNYYVVYNNAAATTRLRIGRINVASNCDVTGCNLYPLASFGGGDHVVDHANMGVGNDRPNFTAADRPIIRSYNGIDSWRSAGLLSSPTQHSREIWRTVAQGAPTTLTWRVGDKTWFLDPVAGGSIGMVCTTAGTPGTWKTFGTISA